MKNPTPERLAFINGKTVPYKFCQEEKSDYYLKLGFKYLGHGVIFAIAGKIQEGKRKYHFYA